MAWSTLLCPSLYSSGWNRTRVHWLWDENIAAKLPPQLWKLDLFNPVEQNTRNCVLAWQDLLQKLVKYLNAILPQNLQEANWPSCKDQVNNHFRLPRISWIKLSFVVCYFNDSCLSAQTIYKYHWLHIGPQSTILLLILCTDCWW